VLNQIVAGVSHMGEDLMEVLLDFRIYFANCKIDALFGRVDENSLSLFPWDDALLAADAAELLNGPPLFPSAAAPHNALPDHKLVVQGDVEWEPVGFEYLRHLKREEAKLDAEAAAALAAGRAAMEVEAQLEAEEEGEEPDADTIAQRLSSPIGRAQLLERAAARAAEDTAATLTAAAHAPSADAAVTPPRAGGLRTTGANKQPAKTIAANTPIKPARPGEVHLMGSAMRKAREAQEQPGADTDATYQRAAFLYLEGVESAYSNRSVAPNAQELRPSPTRADLIREVLEGNLRYSQDIERDRAQHSSPRSAVVALPVAAPAAALAATPAATAPATTAPAAAAPDTSTAQPKGIRRRLKGVEEKKVKKSVRQSVYDNGVKKMALRVAKSAVRGPPPLATRVLMRVAREINARVAGGDGVTKVNTKRGLVRGVMRDWDDIRKDVLEHWPESGEDIELDGETVNES
jgi:hypothetical protein